MALYEQLKARVSEQFPMFQFFLSTSSSSLLNYVLQIKGLIKLGEMNIVSLIISDEQPLTMSLWCLLWHRNPKEAQTSCSLSRRFCSDGAELAGQSVYDYIVWAIVSLFGRISMKITSQQDITIYLPDNTRIDTNHSTPALKREKAQTFSKRNQTQLNAHHVSCY